MKYETKKWSPTNSFFSQPLQTRRDYGVQEDAENPKKDCEIQRIAKRFESRRNKKGALLRPSLPPPVNPLCQAASKMNAHQFSDWMGGYDNSTLHGWFVGLGWPKGFNDCQNPNYVWEIGHKRLKNAIESYAENERQHRMVSLGSSVGLVQTPETRELRKQWGDGAIGTLEQVSRLEADVRLPNGNLARFFLPELREIKTASQKLASRWFLGY